MHACHSGAVASHWNRVWICSTCLLHNLQLWSASFGSRFLTKVARCTSLRHWRSSGSGPFFTQNGSEYYPKMCIHIEKSGVFFGVFWCILVRIHTVSVFLRNTLYSAWNTHEYRCILCILPPRFFAVCIHDTYPCVFYYVFWVYSKCIPIAYSILIPMYFECIQRAFAGGIAPGYARIHFRIFHPLLFQLCSEHMKL